jgi:hypothetical protein
MSAAQQKVLQYLKGAKATVRALVRVLQSQNRDDAPRVLPRGSGDPPE